MVMQKRLTPSIKIIAFTATIGTMLEWAEYIFFAYMADQLSLLFFTHLEVDIARLKTYAIFATSYFMRPIGAILFGTIGDKYGRKKSLLVSMLLMGFATFSIGLLPTYQQIGALAPLMLLLFRLLQGLAVSGEFHGAVTFMHEYASTKPFFIGSFGPFAAAGGMALGAAAATLTLLPGAPSFAWRIPFLCSGILCLIALYFRYHVAESPKFIEAKEQNRLVRSPLLHAFSHKKGLLLSASISLFIAIYVYLGNVFYKTLAIKVGGLLPNTASQIVTLGQTLAALCILFCGWIADKLGGRRLCMIGLCSAIILGPVILYCAQQGEIMITLLGQIIFALINGMVSAPMMTVLMRCFSTESRYTGSALGWSISAAIFGGTALMAGEFMIFTLDWKAGPGFYISLAALIACISLKFTEKYTDKQKITLMEPVASTSI